MALAEANYKVFLEKNKKIEISMIGVIVLRICPWEWLTIQ